MKIIEIISINKQVNQDSRPAFACKKLKFNPSTDDQDAKYCFCSS